jgi:hypothetical protein
MFCRPQGKLSLLQIAFVLVVATINLPAKAETIPCSMPTGNTLSCAGVGTQVSTSVYAVNGVLQLTIAGVFDLPTIDPSLYSIQSATGTLSGDIGGAEWSPIPANNLAYAGVQGGWGLSYGGPNPDTNLTGGGRAVNDVYSHADLFSLSSFTIPSGYLPFPSDLVQGSALDQGGYVPEYFTVSIAAISDSDASELVFIQDPILSVTYNLVSNSSNVTPFLSSSPSASIQQPVYTQVVFGPGDDEIPPSVVSQLPAYVFATTPEPNGGILMAVGIGVLVLGRRSARRSRSLRA